MCFFDVYILGCALVSISGKGTGNKKGDGLPSGSRHRKWNAPLQVLFKGKSRPVAGQKSLCKRIWAPCRFSNPVFQRGNPIRVRPAFHGSSAPGSEERVVFSPGTGGCFSVKYCQGMNLSLPVVP